METVAHEFRRVPLSRRLLWGAIAGLLLGLAAFGAWKPWAAAFAVLGVGAVYGALVVPAFRSGLVLEVFFPSLVLFGVLLVETFIQASRAQGT